jgi:hypothetical protein
VLFDWRPSQRQQIHFHYQAFVDQLNAKKQNSFGDLGVLDIQSSRLKVSIRVVLVHQMRDRRLKRASVHAQQVRQERGALDHGCTQDLALIMSI